MLFRHPLDRRQWSCWLLCFTLLLILSGCVTSNITNNQPKHSTPTLLPGDDARNIAGIRPFIDTWHGIHTFQTFDNNISNPLQIAKYIDFVWGAQPRNVAAFRAGNPNIFLSYYIPSNRDWGTFGYSNMHHNLAYWKAIHPDWILYKCDRVTPAYEFGDSIIPFDFSNAALVQWQTQTYAQPASVHGYDGIAADNVVMQNLFGACGIYRNGQWMQRYTGQVDDAQWRTDVLTWLMRMQKALHHLKHPLALITNFFVGNLAFTDSQVQQLVNYSDGLLDEDGFTDCGRGDLTNNAWLERVQFIERVQEQHKPYYVINESPLVGRIEIQWAIASYLMGKERSSSVFISTLQGYGLFRRYDEYNAQIGTPTGPMYQMQQVYLRDYTQGLSIINSSATKTYTVTLNPQYSYNDLYGNPVQQFVSLPPHSGMVLLKRSS